MDTISKIVEKKYPCRQEIIKTISELIGNPNEAFPPAIFFHGHSGTGKTSIIKEYLRHSRKTKFVYVNCMECYTLRILLDNILEDLQEDLIEMPQCDNIKDFVEKIRKLTSLSTTEGYIIVLDNAERLRDLDANLLPSLLRLQYLCGGINACVVLISQLPPEKYYCKTGLPDVITIYSTQYTKAETLRILMSDFKNAQHLLKTYLKYGSKSQENLVQKLNIVDNITPEFFGNFLNLFLSVFYKACRDVPELKITARKCFYIYMEPVLEGEIEASDVSRLWRHIAVTLRATLSQVYMRLQSDENVDTNSVENVQLDQIARNWTLPYYGKYLLIAAFLASHNSSKEDKRLFVKNHGKHRKRMKSVNAKAKVTEKMATSIGPKSFSIDRLLAIFYAILEEKVGLTCNLLSQISTLVHLKLLSFVSGENNVMDGSSRLQCTVGIECVVNIGKVVGFNVRQYLTDFM